MSSKLIRGRRANTIAKVSDRASNVFDVVSAGSESTDTNDGSKFSQKQGAPLQLKLILPTWQHLTSFFRVFAVNTLLGMAVYSTYEGIIESIAPPAGEPSVVNTRRHTHNDSEQYSEETDDAMDRATLPQHVLSGCLGGASHAILSLVLEMKLHKNSKVDVPGQGMNWNSKMLMSNRFHLQYPTINYSLASLFHHSLAHAVLFGSYQTTKRVLLSNISSNNSNIDITQATIIATAGGIAGQLQHVTSHFSEQILGISGPRISSFYRLTWPTMRSTLLAAPTSSIGFVAFEFGKLVMTAD
jgi:hypothetical protein